MQLFTVGLWQLNDDGSQQLDGTGKPIPTYSNTDVMGLAAVFTGFSWNIPGDNSDTAWSNCCLYVGQGLGEELLPCRVSQATIQRFKSNFSGSRFRHREAGSKRRSQNCSRYLVQSSESACVLFKADDSAHGDQ